MYRILTTLGVLYIALCIGLVARRAPSIPSRVVASTSPPGHGASLSSLPRTPGAVWFEKIRPSCNVLEAETRIAVNPPPDSPDGAAYEAACFALAGKRARAETLIRRLSEENRAAAAGIIFEIGHVVADAGDERSAAPLLELVQEFTPDNPMALYHLGMNEYSQYHYPVAREYLSRFVEVWKKDDFSRKTAEEVLARLESR